jgi:hypothetical protein
MRIKILLSRLVNYCTTHRFCETRLRLAKMPLTIYVERRAVDMSQIVLTISRYVDGVFEQLMWNLQAKNPIDIRSSYGPWIFSSGAMY